MKRQMSWALLAGGIALAASTATAVPAAAAISGSETLTGTLVTSGVSGTRTVISSVLIARGVFNGVGRIVELPSQPGDPPNTSRDDLVYPEGTMHLLTTPTGGSLSINPDSCVATATATSTAQITGGTGQFTNATGSFTGTDTGRGVAARNPDGSCALDKPALHEVEILTSTGTLSF
jgi:hypothetical protein